MINKGRIKMEKTLLKVDGMSCMHCEAAVKKAVGSIEGVESVEVSLADKTVSVSYNNEVVTVDDIKIAIEDQGYDTID